MVKKAYKEAGMRSPTMPKDHFEKSYGNLAVGREKYATEFGNPADLERSAQDLVNFAKKKRMAY
jgi:hypothetical protein